MSPNKKDSKTGILRVEPIEDEGKAHKRVKFHEHLATFSPSSVADVTKQQEVLSPLSDVSSKEMAIGSTETAASTKPGWSLKQTILAWTSMILAVIAASSIGPVFKYMETQGIGPLLAASWRCQCMVMFLLPLAIIEGCSSKEKRVDWFKVKPGLTFPVIVHLIFSGLAWAGNLLTWIVGLQYTTTFKASLIASCHPILLVFIMRFYGTRVSCLEWSGVFISFGGMVLSSAKDLFGPTPEESQETMEKHKYEFLGYFLCFLAASFEVMVLFNRIATKKYVPLMQYTAGTTIIVATMASVSSLLLEGGTVLSSSSASHGIEVFCRQENCIFGWTSDKWALRVILFGLWVGVICIAGFNYAMQYIPPLIFSSCGLVDPAITAILSWLIGVESLPTLLTWIGGFTVMTGVGVITVGDHLRSEEEHRQAAAAAGLGGGGEADSDKLSALACEEEEEGDGEKGGIALSVLHGARSSGSTTLSGGGSGGQGKYAMLGTDDEDDVGFSSVSGGDVEQGPVSHHDRIRDNDEGMGEGVEALSAEEERMLHFIRSRSAGGQHHQHRPVMSDEDVFGDV